MKGWPEHRRNNCSKHCNALLWASERLGEGKRLASELAKSSYDKIVAIGTIHSYDVQNDNALGGIDYLTNPQ
jgi:hypothetical protein